MQIGFTLDIQSDLETVFSWIANPDKAMVWMTSVAGGQIIDLRPGMVGITFRDRVEEGGGGIEMHGSITAFEPNHRISFHLESRVNRRMWIIGSTKSETSFGDGHLEHPLEVPGQRDQPLRGFDHEEEDHCAVK
jgi:uncharacterized protein YndB with AHSA1/START domain